MCKEKCAKRVLVVVYVFVWLVCWLGFVFVLFYFIPTHVELLDLGFWKLLKSNLWQKSPVRFSPTFTQMHELPANTRFYCFFLRMRNFKRPKKCFCLWSFSMDVYFIIRNIIFKHSFVLLDNSNKDEIIPIIKAGSWALIGETEENAVYMVTS